MILKLTIKDIELIANESLQMRGVYTPIEIELARRVLRLTQRIGIINNERNEFRDALVSVMNTSEKCLSKIDNEIKARNNAELGKPDSTGTTENTH